MFDQGQQGFDDLWTDRGGGAALEQKQTRRIELKWAEFVHAHTALPLLDFEIRLNVYTRVRAESFHSYSLGCL